MNEWLLPAVVLAAVLVLTYLFCVRPMRRGGCLHRSQTRPTADLDRQLELARRELQRLRAEPDHAPAHGADGDGPGLVSDGHRRPSERTGSGH